MATRKPVIARRNTEHRFVARDPVGSAAKFLDVMPDKIETLRDAHEKAARRIAVKPGELRDHARVQIVKAFIVR